MYADDTRKTHFHFSSKDTSEIGRVSNMELELIHNWLYMNKLFLNLVKTEVVLFGTGANLAKATNFRVSIGHYHLKQVMEYKYLGVFLDNRLMWKTHMEYVTTQGAFYTKATPKLCPCLDKVTPRATRNSKITKTSSNVTPQRDMYDVAWL